MGDLEAETIILGHEYYYFYYQKIVKKKKKVREVQFSLTNNFYHSMYQCISHSAGSTLAVNLYDKEQIKFILRC